MLCCGLMAPPSTGESLVLLQRTCIPLQHPCILPQHSTTASLCLTRSILRQHAHIPQHSCILLAAGPMEWLGGVQGRHKSCTPHKAWGVKGEVNSCCVLSGTGKLPLNPWLRSQCQPGV